MSMIIRQETARDYDAVYNLVKQAFKSAEQSDGNEHMLVDALRTSSAFVPALSLVAEIDGELVGHILFTEIHIGGDAEIALGLAPLSVSPAHQRQGIGLALMQEGHRIAAALGYSYSIVVGSEAYYPKAGYTPAADFGITAPFDVPPPNFMALRLRADAKPVRGVVAYAKEFGI